MFMQALCVCKSFSLVSEDFLVSYPGVTCERRTAEEDQTSSRTTTQQQHPSPLCAGSEARRRTAVVSKPYLKTPASQHEVPEPVHRARRPIAAAIARRSLVAAWPSTTLTPC